MWRPACSEEWVDECSISLGPGRVDHSRMETTSKYTEGQRVVTNDLEWGTISFVCETSGWYDVRLDKGGMASMNDERLTTRHPFGDKDPKGHFEETHEGLTFVPTDDLGREEITRGGINIDHGGR